MQVSVRARAHQEAEGCDSGFSAARGSSRAAAARAQGASAPTAASAAATPPVQPTNVDGLVARQRLWDDLLDAERAKAAALGFQQWYWDASIRAVHQDIGIERTNPLYKDLELDYNALNYNSIKQILGVRLCSTLEMSDAQREAPLPEADVKPSFLVRGEFENMRDDSESYKDTLWVPFDQVAAAGLNCDGEDDDGDWPDYARVIDTFFTTVNRLRTMARAKAVAAAAAEAAGVCTMPGDPLYIPGYSLMPDDTAADGAPAAAEAAEALVAVATSPARASDSNSARKRPAPAPAASSARRAPRHSPPSHQPAVAAAPAAARTSPRGASSAGAGGAGLPPLRGGISFLLFRYHCKTPPHSLLSLSLGLSLTPLNLSLTCSLSRSLVVPLSLVSTRCLSQPFCFSLLLSLARCSSHSLLTELAAPKVQ